MRRQADHVVDGYSLLKTGSFTLPAFGEIEITPVMLAEMVRNFDAGTYGQAVFVDVAHNPANGAAGEITRLWPSGLWLMADVAWTPYGQAAIMERGFQYLSAEFDRNFRENEQPRRWFGAVLLGAGLTIRPWIKDQAPIGRV